MKRRVWIGLVFGLVATGAWWIWVRGTAQDGKRGAARLISRPFVRLTGTGVGERDALVREKAEYFDPTPLFFPTEWNFGQDALRRSMQRQPGQAFGDYKEILNTVTPEQGMKSYQVEMTAAPEHLADVLGQGNEAPFGGMGERDVTRGILPERSAFLEITDFNGGKIVVAQALVGFSVPHPDFEPLEFLAVVSNAGLVGAPVLKSGSGWDDVDAFAREYLMNTYRIGERLAPGRYRVLFGP